jgi:hypothetical protein
MGGRVVILKRKIVTAILSRQKNAEGVKPLRFSMEFCAKTT